MKRFISLAVVVGIIIAGALAMRIADRQAEAQIGVSLPSPSVKYFVCAASSGGAQANNCTLTAAAGLTTCLTDVQITGAGATSGSVISVTITGTSSSATPTYFFTVPSGATTAATMLNLHFETPLIASDKNTAIVVNVPSFGTGNLSAGVVAIGYQTQ